MKWKKCKFCQKAQAFSNKSFSITTQSLLFFWPRKFGYYQNPMIVFFPLVPISTPSLMEKCVKYIQDKRTVLLNFWLLFAADVSGVFFNCILLLWAFYDATYLFGFAYTYSYDPKSTCVWTVLSSDLSHMGRKNNSSHQIKSIYHITIYLTTI